MLNAVYRLVAPRRFEVEFGEVPLFGQEVGAANSRAKPLPLSGK